MAGTGVDDVSSQLGLTNQLLRSNELMSEVLQRITGQHGEQLEMLKTMSQVIDTMSSDIFTRIAEEAEEAARAVTELTDSMLDLADVLELLDEDYIDVDRSQRRFSEGVVKGAKKGVKESQNLSDNLYTLGKVFDKLKKKTKDYIDTLAKTSMPLLAVQGLVKGFGNLLAVVQGGLSIITTVLGSLMSLATTIISFPFKAMSSLIDLAASTDPGLYQTLEKIKGVLGELNGPTASGIVTTAKNMEGFEKTGLSAMRVFGTFGERMEMLLNLAQEMGPAFRKLQEDFKGAEGVALAYQKGLGFTGDEMRTVTSYAQAFGVSADKSFRDVTKQALGLGKAFGIDSKILSKDLSKALKDVAHFGNASVKQLAQAAVYARGLGTELEKIVGVMDAFDSFEDAATNASKLNQQLGIQVDAFKMMAAETPDEKINMLRTAMAAAGKSAESLDRFQLRMLSSSVGLDVETTRLAFSLKNQGLSLEQIKKKGEGLDKKTMTQEEAMSKLADSIEKLVKVQEGGFFSQLFSGISAGMQDTKEFQDAIYNIKDALHNTYEWGIKFGKMIMTKFPIVRDVISGIAKLFDPNNFSRFLDKISKTFGNFISDMSTGKFSLAGLLDSLKENFFSWFNASGSGGKLLEALKNMFKVFIEIIAQGIKLGGSLLADGLTAMADVLSGRKPLTGVAAQGAGFLSEAFSKLGDAFKEAFVKLGPALKDFATSLFKKIGEIIMGPELAEVRRKIMMALAAVTFGPALLQMGLGMFARTLTAAGPKIAEVATNAATAAAPAAPAAGKAGWQQLDLFKKAVPEEAPLKGAVEATSAGSKLPGAIPPASVTGPATQNLPSFANFLSKFAAIAVAGLIAFLGAILIIKATGATPEEVRSAGTVLVAIALSALIMTPALKMINAMGDIDKKKLTSTMLGIATALLIGIPIFSLAIRAVTDVPIGDVLTAAAVLLILPGVVAAAAGALWAVSKAPKTDKSLMSTLGQIVLVLTAGMVPFGLAVAMISAMNVSAETLSKTMMFLMSIGAVMLAAAGVVGIAAMLGKFQKTKEYVIQGLISLGAVIGAMIITAWAMAGIAAATDAAKMAAAGVLLEAVANAFLKATVVVFGLMAIGALSASTAFASDGAVALGLISLGTVITAMVLTANGILESLNKMSGSPEQLKTRAEAFAAIMSTVVNLAEKIGNIISAMNFSIFESNQDKIDRLNKVAWFVSQLIGEEKNSAGKPVGIIGLVTTLTTRLKDINKADIAAANAAAPLFSSVASLMGALLEPAKEILKEGEQWHGGIDTEKITNSIDMLGKFIDAVGSRVQVLSREIINIFSGLDVGQLSKLKMAGEGFSSILTGLSSLLKAVVPALEAFKKSSKSSVGWGLYSSEDKGLDWVAVGRVILGMVEGLSTMSEPVKSFIESVAKMLGSLSFSKSTVEGLKEIGPIIGSVGTIINAISSSFKENVTETETPDKTKVRNVVSVAPDYAKIITDISNNFPTLFSGIMNLIRSIPYNKGMKKKLESVSTIFDIIAKVPDIVNSINDMEPVDKVDPDKKTTSGGIEKAVEFFEKLLEGGDNSPIVRLVKLIGRVAAATSRLKTGVAIGKASKRVETVLSAADGIISKINTISDHFKDENYTPPDFTNMNSYFNSLLGRDEKGFDLGQMLTNMTTVFGKIQHFSRGMPDVTKAIKKITENVSALKGLSDASTDMSTDISGLRDLGKMSGEALESSKTVPGPMTVPASARLKPTPGTTSFSDSTTSFLKNGEIVINVNLDVTMDTMKIESAILQQPNSEIRMRLNRALDPSLPASQRAVVRTQMLQPTDHTNLTSVPAVGGKYPVELARQINGKPTYVDWSTGQELTQDVAVVRTPRRAR